MNAKFLHISPGAFIFVIMLMLCCAPQPACGSPPSGSPPVSLIPEILEQDEPQETVTINGETYIIPPPWTGNRFTAPDLDFSDFRRIPVEYTQNSSKIYILAVAHQPLEALLQEAEKDGIFLKVESAYRSEGYQKRIFKRMLTEGRTFEDIIRYVAPPGYSQHVFGTAVDFFPSDWSFADTDAYSWLRENGRRFGFEETYSQFNQLKMPWESWHWNFTGNKDANQASSDLSPDPISAEFEANTTK